MTKNILSKEKIILLLIILFAVSLRLFVIIKFNTYLKPNIWEHEEIANSLLLGRGFLYHFLGQAPYRSFNAPLYSVVCAIIYSLTGHSYFAVLFINSLFSVFLALIIYRIAKSLFNEWVGIFSALVTSFHPGFVYYDVFNLIPLSIDSFLIALIVFLFLKFRQRLNIINMSLVGIAIGIGFLSRGIIGTILVALFIYIFIFLNSVEVKNKLKIFLPILISCVIISSPWIIRNYLIHKEFVLISTLGENLWRGNNLYASGTSYSIDGKPIIELFPEEFRLRVYSLGEMEQKKFFEKEAWGFIKDQPLDFAKLYIKKLYYFWWFSPQSGILYPKIYLRIYSYFYSLLLFFYVLGFAISLRSKIKNTRDGSWLVIFVILGICFSQSLFYVEGRHRWLIEPLLIIFSMYGLYEAVKFIKNKSYGG